VFLATSWRKNISGIFAVSEWNALRRLRATPTQRGLGGHLRRGRKHLKSFCQAFANTLQPPRSDSRAFLYHLRQTFVGVCLVLLARYFAVQGRGNSFTSGCLASWDDHSTLVAIEVSLGGFNPFHMGQAPYTSNLVRSPLSSIAYWTNDSAARYPTSYDASF
jgi:hypothetical protein